MKKLLIISSVLIAFSAANLFANEQPVVNNGDGQAISAFQVANQDTVPKKDTAKRKSDTTSHQFKQK